MSDNEASPIHPEDEPTQINEANECSNCNLGGIASQGE